MHLLGAILEFRGLGFRGLGFSRGLGIEVQGLRFSCLTHVVEEQEIGLR